MKRSRSAEQTSRSSTCEPGLLGLRRSEIVVDNRSAEQYIDTTKFIASASSVDDATAAGSSKPVAALRSSTPRSDTSSETSSSDCHRWVVDQVVDWATVRLLFVVLDVLLLVHRLTKLYVELDRMQFSTPAVGCQFSPLSDGCAGDVSFLPVDGVASPSGPEPTLPHIGNHVGSEDRGLDEDDEEVDVDVVESTTNSLCVRSDRRGSNSVSSTFMRRQSTGNRWPGRRRTGSSSDIIPRLVCLVALLAALFYARSSTTIRGLLSIRGALPSLRDSRSPSVFTAAVRRHFYDDIGVSSLSSDFRQLQAFVDFFNRGKLIRIFTARC